MITAAFVTQFHDSFEIASQQKDSRLQAAVNDRGMITGAS
ncbi:phage capsid protein, partial [Citrobacter amalonaticus]